MFRLDITQFPSDIPLKDSLFERSTGLHMETHRPHPPSDISIFPGSVRLLKAIGPVSESISHSNLTFLPLQRSHLLCVLAVPTSLDPHHVEAHFHLEPDDLSYARVVVHNGGIYTVIFSFAGQARADRFYQEFNGHEYNERTLEICYVVFLSELVFTQEQPEAGLIELPSCPVCLERLDVFCSGIVGVLRTSQACPPEDRWLETIEYCQVCRMIGRPTSPLLKLTHSSSLEKVHCAACPESNSLWICLLCGYIGCGRYSSAHAHSHCESFRHNFVLELDTQRIWDYQGDNYVHRVIRSGPDLFFPDSHIEEGESMEKSDDVELLAWEYNYLINSQLEQQRGYFEAKIEERLRTRDLEPLVEILQDEIIRLQIAAQEKHKNFSKMKLMEKKRTGLRTRLAKEQEELALLTQANEGLKQRLSEQQQGIQLDLKFADKKSKELFLKKQKLQKRVQELMQRISSP
jgi:BRCA1-associated protein